MVRVFLWRWFYCVTAGLCGRRLVMWGGIMGKLPASVIAGADQWAARRNEQLDGLIAAFRDHAFDHSEDLVLVAACQSAFLQEFRVPQGECADLLSIALARLAK